MEEVHWTDKDRGERLVITFGGAAFAALREDQRDYVQHLMLSWRRVDQSYYDIRALRRAIKKARQNLP